MTAVEFAISAIIGAAIVQTFNLFITTLEKPDMEKTADKDKLVSLLSLILATLRVNTNARSLVSGHPEAWDELLTHWEQKLGAIQGECVKCDGPGGKETFANQVCMPIGTRVECIDQCIHQIVAALNAGGVKTVASCCGHGDQPGRIDLTNGRTLMIHTVPVEESNAEKELAEIKDYLWPDQEGMPNRHRNALVAIKARDRLSKKEHEGVQELPSDKPLSLWDEEKKRYRKDICHHCHGMGTVQGGGECSAGCKYCAGSGAAPRFVHDPDNDWGRIRDVEREANIAVIGHVPEDIAKQCREAGTDPHQDRVDELLILLNAKAKP